MALNISLPSAAITELESYQWFNSGGVSLKDVTTHIFFTSIWINVSDYVRSIDIRGSINNLSGEPGANTATVEFANNDKRFSDLNAASPYSGSLSPYKKVKIDLSVMSSTVTIFIGRVLQSGFVESRQGHEGSATIEMADESDRFQRKKFPVDYYYETKKMVDHADASNSLLHILLETHGGLQHSTIVCNGTVSYNVPYTVFKEGESIQARIQELARGCLVQYAGFRYDGKYVFESRLIPGWSEPSSEYTLTAATTEIDLMKDLVPLIGNRVKVRGDKVELDTDRVLWELRKIKRVGVNRVYPGWCWETVANGDWYLCSDPTLSTPVDFYAQYEVDGGEIIHVYSTALSQKLFEGTNLTTTGSDLEAESTRGKLMLRNSTGATVHVMNIQIKGNVVIRRSLGMKSESDIKALKLDQGLSDDDMNWGYVAVASNTSSIADYGQTDLVISSEYITQTEQIAKIIDWHLKYGKDPKHAFQLNNLPFLAFAQPGAPVMFGLTDLGYSGMAEVASFGHHITPDGAQTTLNLLESPGNWAVSMGATVREVMAAPSGGTGEGELGAINIGGNTKYYIGAAGCSLPVDIMCDGVGDHEEWNEAINTVAERGGGIVAGIGGTFVTSAPISMMAGVCLELNAGVTIKKNGNYNAIEALGTATTHMANIAVIGKGTVTRDAGDTYTKDLVYFDYAEDFELQNIIIDSSYSDGAYLQNCVNGRVGGGMKLFGCGGSGLKMVASRTIIAASLIAISCLVGCDIWPSLTTDMIDRGDCESTISPMLSGEVSALTSNCTWARDASVAYSGTYSYKYSIISGGIASYAALTDSFVGLNGATAGKLYLFTCKMYIPSGGILCNEIMILCENTATIAPMVKPKAIYSTWQNIAMLIETPSTMGTFWIRYAAATTASSGEFYYADDIHLYEFDETDSGCQLVNSSVEQCADGIIVANSQVIIQNNQVTGCKSTGITIAAGYRNLVNNNRCFNNGADTGLSNDNQHNFYDAGIDTQVG